MRSTTFRRPPPHRLLLGLLPVLVLVACTPARVRMPATPMPGASAHDVHGHSPRDWRQPLAFGPFRTAPVVDGGTFAWTESVEGTTLVESLRPYRFVLRAGDGPSVEVECRTQKAVLVRPRSGFELDASAFNRDTRLECALHAPGHGTWLLTLRGTRDGRLSGELERGITLLQVRSLHAYEGSGITSPEPLGYAIDDGEAPAMVVETINAGRVVLAATPKDRHPVLAAAAAALLLFDPEMEGGG